MWDALPFVSNSWNVDSLPWAMFMTVQQDLSIPTTWHGGQGWGRWSLPKRACSFHSKIDWCSKQWHFARVSHNFGQDIVEWVAYGHLNCIRTKHFDPSRVQWASQAFSFGRNLLILPGHSSPHPPPPPFSPPPSPSPLRHQTNCPVLIPGMLINWWNR